MTDINFLKLSKKKIFTEVPHTKCHISNLRQTVLVSLKVPKYKKIIKHFISLGCKKPGARTKTPCTKAPRTEAPWTKAPQTKAPRDISPKDPG